MSSHSIRRSTRRSTRARHHIIKACVEAMENRQYLTATLTPLYQFTGGADGINPWIGLVADASGNLYGTTVSSASGGGTVFEYDLTTGQLIPRGQFPDGVNSHAPLTIDSAGNLYGTTYNGGDSNGDGTIFEVKQGTNTITTLASFDGDNGSDPTGALAIDSAGNLYGTTYKGGQDQTGTVYELPANRLAIQTLATFDGATDGEFPEGGIYRNAAGNLFGTTQGNSDYSSDSDGTVFEVIPGNQTPILLHAFDGDDGSGPISAIIADPAGDLYGSTYSGGSGEGTIFELAASNGQYSFNSLGQFDGDNGDEISGITRDVQGDIFGIAEAGGSLEDGSPAAGAIFELTPGASGTPIDVYPFNADTDPYAPSGEVVADSAGNLYGVCKYGGTDGDGALVELTDTGFDTTTISLTPPSTELATAGTSQSFNLGSFTATNGTAPYTVTVDWHDANGPGDSVPGSGSDVTTFTMNSPGTITPQSHTFPSAGNYFVYETVTDADGHTSGQYQFTAQVAIIAVTPASNQDATAGSSQSFNLGSFGVNNTPAGDFEVDVNWGDGSADTTFSMNEPMTITPQSHTYSSAGADTVSVTVSDGGIISNTGTFTATVAPAPVSITATAASNQSATAGTGKSFSLGSFTESNATGPYTVSVNWGDGSADTTFAMAAAGAITPQSHTYGSAGSDTVAVVVTDSAGHTSNTATFSAAVAAPPVTIATTAAAGQIATAGTATSFSLGSFSEADATGPYTVSVNWGDGSAVTSFGASDAGSIPAQSHSFADPGPDTVSVSVSDSAGHTSNTAMFAVAVAPAPGQTTVTIHVYDDPNQTGSTASPQAGRQVFVDADGGGVYEAGEASAITGADGSATLYLAAGQGGEIAEIVPDGMVQLEPATDEVAVAANSGSVAVNFFTKALSATPVQSTTFFSNYSLGNLTASSGYEADAAITQPDGKVIIAGTDRTGSTPQAFIARYLPDGEADAAFGGGGLVYGPAGTVAASVVEEPDGTVYLASNGSGANAGIGFVSGFTAAGVAASTSAYSTADSTATVNPATVKGLTLAADGSLLLSGVVGVSNSSTAAKVSFITDLAESTLQPVAAFGTAGTVVGTTSGVSLIASVKITAAGALDLLTETTAGPVLQTYAANGSLSASTSFGAAVGTGFTPQVAALQADGKFVIAGIGPSSAGGNFVLTVARVNADGSADTSFGTNGIVSEDESSRLNSAGTLVLCDAAVLGDGTILVTGKYDDASASVFQCFCQEYTSAGAELLGYGGTNQLVVTASSAAGVVGLAKLSGVLPVVSDASTDALVAQPAFVNGSVGFNAAVVPLPTMLTGRDIADLDVETTRPTAIWQTPLVDPITTGTAAEEVQVEFTDPIAINLRSLGTGNLLVTLPGGTTEIPTFLGVERTGGTTNLYADYSVAPVGGAWTAADNGDYTVSLVKNQVFNTALAAAAGDLGTFTVDISNGTSTVSTVQTASTITLSAASATVQSGNFTTLTATVASGDSAVTTAPTGLVTFYDGDTAIGTAPVSGGIARFATVVLSAGSHTITATYGGDSTYLASAPSTAVGVTVTGPAVGAPVLSASLAHAKLPAALIEGKKQKMIVALTVTNVGGAIERGPITMVLYASTSSTLDENAVAAAPAVHPKVSLKPGASHTFKLVLPGLPATLGAGTFYLLGQVIDAAGFAQTAVTATTVTVAAPFNSPAVSITRMPVSLVSGENTRGPLVLLLSDGGNVPIAGQLSITVYATASGAIDANSIKILTVKPKVSIAAGKAKSIAVHLGKLPVLTSGTYQLGVTIGVPAVDGAAATTVMAISASTFDVA